MACNLQSFSGEWKGYYEYNQSKHEMTCSLIFGQDGTIIGQGSDDIGKFTISGKVEASNSFAFTKQYVGAHSVDYSGTVQWGDQPTLQGQWQVGGQSDGFMLSPERSLQSFSGEWKGYYEYNQSKHEMTCSLTFGQDGTIIGQGSDDIGKFTISGKVEASNSFAFTKQYVGAHSVDYSGTVQWGDQPTLQGQWQVGGQSDGFMLSPERSLQSFSGEWKGYYEYNQSKHEMTCSLTFGQDGTIIGQGSDDIGKFTISGKVEASNSFAFTKQYVGAHSVDYSGTVQWGDQPTLQGQWQVGGQSDGFMLSPERSLQSFSGEWKGYYEYNQSKHEMTCSLTFGQDGTIIGQGSDDIGKFTISGKVEASNSFAFTKQYVGAHSVDYSGTVQWGDQPTLQGQWQVGGQSDGFMLSPERSLQSFSGEWKGYYEYNQSKHEMTCSLTFGQDGTIIGQGSDDIGKFTISGKVEASNSFAFTKQYVGAHSVDYSGTVQWGDQPTLQGQWQVGGQSDGFMLSPERSLQSFSGEWKGYYEYNQSKHEMTCSLTFGQDGTIIGQGSDDIGKFTISGKVEASNSFAFTKQYVGAHSVDYSGTVQWGDLPTLQGQWQVGGQSDGFMLSPERSLQSFSGEWKGYYEQYRSKHEMTCSLTFSQDGTIIGQGSDDIGSFTISGKMEASGSFAFTKQYVGAHSVAYSGTVQWGDLPTLQGQWHLGGQSGGFMLSPERSLQSFNGEWKGYYEQYCSKHEMMCSLTFSQDGTIIGQGSDDIGSFTISGKMEASGSFAFTKQYMGAHSVAYSGTVQWGDLPTLQGQWHLGGQSGGFMLSPERSLQSFSGEWKGYYEQYRSKHEMTCSLTFSQDGTIIGQGSDDIGSFTISGKMEASGSFAFTKQYMGAHSVAYSGTIQWGDLPTLQGQWHLGGQSGGFMLSPVD